MSAWTANLPAPELPDGARSALIVATSTYDDPTFRALRAPSTDADEFAKVLADPAIGGFDVTKVVDGSAHEIMVAIEDFLNLRTASELVLVYLSCHGVTDGRRRLHFAATDTEHARLASTAVSSPWVNERLEECRARRQVLILDCCFSGAFAHGSKGVKYPAFEGLNEPGRGRVVLTASNAIEYSFESTTAGAGAEHAPSSRSFFTAALVKGLSTGSADTDGDGLITVSDAFQYARREVRAMGADQTPQRWMERAEGEIPLARSPAGREIHPMVVPESVQSALDSPHPSVRIGAVNELAEWLVSDDLNRVVTARLELARVAEDDIPRVAAPARQALEHHPPHTPPTSPNLMHELPTELESANVQSGLEWEHPQQSVPPSSGNPLPRHPVRDEVSTSPSPPYMMATARLEGSRGAGRAARLLLKLGREHTIVAESRFWNDTLKIDGRVVERGPSLNKSRILEIAEGEHVHKVIVGIAQAGSSSQGEYVFTKLLVDGMAVEIEESGDVKDTNE